MLLFYPPEGFNVFVRMDGLKSGKIPEDYNARAMVQCVSVRPGVC